MAYFSCSVNVGLFFCNLVAKVQYSRLDVVFFFEENVNKKLRY